MAERRMFTKKITDSDAFTELPPTAQALYFHLCMSADDDGFSNQTRKAIFNAQATKKDLDLLIEKKFIIFFEDRGIAVVKHWKMHNYIQKDRYNKTKYTDEMSKLTLKNNGVYSLVDKMDTDCIQNVSNMETQVRLGKDRIGKDRIGKDRIGEYEGETRKAVSTPPKEPKKHFGEYQHVLMTENEYGKLCVNYGEQLTKECITFLDEYIEMKGYKAKSHYMCVIKWVVDAVKERKAKQNTTQSKGAEELNGFYNMVDNWVAKKKGENA